MKKIHVYTPKYDTIWDFEPKMGDTVVDIVHEL